MFMPVEMFGDMIRPQAPKGKRPDPDRLMKMDVIDKGDSYEVSTELPGFSKEEIGIELKMGNLVISAFHENTKDNSDDEKYIRRERITSSCRRSIYIGQEYTSEDVSAKFENGVLVIVLPKKEKKEPEDKKIEIM